MTLEDKLEAIGELGWYFNLQYNDIGFSLSLCKPEWITDNLYQDKPLPTFGARELSVVVDWVYNYVTS